MKEFMNILFLKLKIENVLKTAFDAEAKKVSKTVKRVLFSIPKLLNISELSF